LKNKKGVQMIPNNINRFIALSKSKLTYEDDAGEGPAGSNKKAFHSMGKSVMKAIANALKLPEGSYDIRSNYGGIAVSGEITLHAENIYIQASVGVAGGSILYRVCKGRKDYSGGWNHWMAISDLKNWDSAMYTFKGLELSKRELY
jgi:hypothetical protein